MVDKRVKNLSIEEKAKFVRGETTWYLHSKKENGIKRIKVNDGPHGLRVEIPNSIGVFKPSYTAICFPTAAASACSFSVDAMEKLGRALGKEAKLFGTHILLGPGVNIKRNPLCGRNFEYFSEDPYLTGELASHFINAVQKEGIGTSIKHFALNNQETLRSSINSVCDKRAMREIYLYAFEKAIKESQPYTIMASYNMVNGIFACENEYLLTTLAKKEFGFEGFIVSDWGAVNDINASIKAGLDLEMPYFVINENKSIESLKEDKTLIPYYENSISRQVKVIDKCLDLEEKQLDEETLINHHKLAKELALESVVLLKNKNEALPIKEEEKVLFVGPFAYNPRYQGAGSSHIASFKVDNFLDYIKDDSRYEFKEGYKLDLSMNDSLINEVIEASKNVDKVICFLGLPQQMESEGFDRSTMSLPMNQIKLIDELYKNGIEPIVILENGSAVEIPFNDKISGLLECYLGGEAINAALYDLIFGKVSPSGRLSETFAYHYEDYPSSPYFPGDGTNVLYKESIYVGYRYFDKANKEVLYPFGYGLTYSKFKYDDLKISYDEEALKINFKVTNISSRKAKETSLVYVSKPNTHVFNAVKELKAFKKFELESGESKIIVIKISKEDLCYFDIKFDKYLLSEGEYEILVGSNSKELNLKDKIYIPGVKHNPYDNQKINSYINGTIMNVNNEEYANLFEDQKIPLLKETFVGEYDYNTSITYALKDSKGALKLHQHLLEIDVIKAKPYILKMLEDLPIRMLATNFGFTQIEYLDVFKNLFNDIEIDKNFAIISEIFKKVFMIIRGK